MLMTILKYDRRKSNHSNRKLHNAWTFLVIMVYAKMKQGVRKCLVILSLWMNDQFMYN